MKRIILPAIATMLLVLTGCATSVSDLVVTTRDEDVYSNKNVTTKDYQSSNYVLETRGGGEIACINIGKKDGAKKGTKVEFFIINESMGKKYKVMVASGRVFQASEDTSWVKIKNYETADVKKKSFAQVASDQSYSFGEKMLFPPRFWQ